MTRPPSEQTAFSAARNTRTLASAVIVRHTREAQISFAFHSLARPEDTLTPMSARITVPTTIAARDEIASRWIVEVAILDG